MKLLNIVFCLFVLITQAHTQNYQLYFGNERGDNVVTLDRVEENLPIAVEYELNMQQLNRSFSYALDSAVAVIQEDSELNTEGLRVIHIDGFEQSYEICESSDPSYPFVIRFDNRIFAALSLETALDKIRNDMWYRFTNQK